MKQQQILDLIQASQTTIKQDLLQAHPDSKYQLLMLSRSFDLIKHYISEQQQAQQLSRHSLEQYFSLPILDLEEGIRHLAQDLRHQLPSDALTTLQKLNEADLMITHPKLITQK